MKRLGDRSSARPPGSALRRLAATFGKEDAKLLIGAGLVLVGAIKTELSTPGRGRIRQRETKRIGAGSYRIKKVAAKLALVPVPEQLARKRVRRGVPMTVIGNASRASAPGDPPAPDEGVLRNSIQEDVGENTVRVGTNDKRARPLNNGTTTAGRSHRVVILPRPFMQPALAKARSQMSGPVIVALHERAAEAAE